MADIPIHRGSLVPVSPGPGGPCGALTDMPLGVYQLSNVDEPPTDVATLIYPRSDLPPLGMVNKLPLASRVNDPLLPVILKPVGSVGCDPDDYSTGDWRGRILQLAIFIPALGD